MTKYYEALVKQYVEIPTRNGSKTKINRDRILVDSDTISGVETKVHEIMKDNPNEWDLVSVKESPIVEVIDR
jgi:hypothetical protein